MGLISNPISLKLEGKANSLSNSTCSLPYMQVSRGKTRQASHTHVLFFCKHTNMTNIE